MNLRLAALSAATLLTLAGNAPRRPPMSGALTKPLAQYTGDEFFQFTRGLSYGGGAERARRCRGNPACTGGGRVNVRIDAVTDEDSLSTATIPANGVIAARAENRGNGTEDRYGMQSGGRFSYYLVVLPGGTWALEELDRQGQSTSHHTVATGRFNGCNHPFVSGAKADFKTCAQAGAGHPTFSFASVETGTIDPPIWIGCASGCCTADQS